MAVQRCLVPQVARIAFALGVTSTLGVLWLLQTSLEKTPDPRFSSSYRFQVTVKPIIAQIPAPSSDVDDVCPVFQLMPGTSPARDGSCRRADFLPGSCRIMKTIFREEPANCSHQPSHIICKLSDLKKPHVRCRPDICRTSSDVSIGLYLSNVGRYIWHKLKSTQELETFINSELLVDGQVPNNGFCVIECMTTAGASASQLLILPPVLHTRRRPRDTHSPRALLNIHILLLDSVSRHHFYRSLPRTIGEFKRLNEGYFTRGQVFDFELLQGIKSRTFESLQALFGGRKYLPPIVDASSRTQGIVHVNETFGKFRALGYETLYVEDLCWLSEWGLANEQGALNLSAPFQERVKLFQEALAHAEIDRIDVSYSNCLILMANRVKNQFHGPPSICYNGIHQHSYLLQYMEYFISRFSSVRRPTFTFMMLDTGHEDTGIRVKQMDQDLAGHVSFLAHQENTISFILSDHGNTYGRALSASPEFQVEIFHPSLFVVVPDGASRILGDAKMKAMHSNQKRLVSLVDVHDTLSDILSSMEPMYQTPSPLPKFPASLGGLLSPIPSSRTCRDIPRLHPNLCICQNSYKMEKNSTYYALFAEFALSDMNRRIFEHRSSGREPCPRLAATMLTNVKISEEDGGDSLIVMDLHVRSPDTTRYVEERFTVSVLFGSTSKREGLMFLGYHRLTPFSAYKPCADPAIDLQLCICDPHSGYGNATVEDPESEGVSWTKTYRTAIHWPCLFLKTRNYTEGVVLLVSNVCSHRTFRIVFNFISQNLYSSTKMPLRRVVEPGMEGLLVVGIRRKDELPWKYRYTLTFKQGHN